VELVSVNQNIQSNFLAEMGERDQYNEIKRLDLQF
jgi:hypothetical protein